jgi:PKD repeat protein
MKKTSLIAMLGVLSLLLCLVYPVVALGEIGVVRNNNTWLLDSSGDGRYGDGDIAYTFGKSGDLYITGDWNHDKKTEIGVIRNSKIWILDTSGNGAFDSGDVSYSFGQAGDVFVSGDWNTDGKTEIGVIRNGNVWYLDASGDGRYGPGDLAYSFGKAGDVYVTGDWNNDGKTEIGVVRNNNTWYLDASGDGRYGAGDLVCSFGKAGDIFISGDWNNDGKTEIGVIRNGNTWYLDASGDGRYGAGDLTYTFGKGGDTPAIGKWIAASEIPVVAFTNATPRIGTSPLTVTFTDQSTASLPLTYAWDYNNDGVIDSTEKNPTHVYSTIGTFTVNLTVNTTSGCASEVKTDYITVYPAPVAPVSQFEASPTTGTPPLTVMFTDQSTNTPTSWKWEYRTGGGSWTEFGSGARNPSNTFATGTYDIRLTSSNAGGFDDETKYGYIIAAVAPAAAFTTNVREEYAPLTVRFTDQSTGTTPLTYAWDFTNDWDYESSQQNPSYTYYSPGTYTVRLRVTNVAGSDEEIKTGYITVNEVPVAPTAAFTSNKRGGSAPLTVRFTDQSTGTTPLTYAWDFENSGSTDSCDKNPSFTYSTPGTYTVKQTVTNDLGTNIERKTDYITVTESLPGGPRAGIALTFDDNSIDQWYAIRDMLQQYNAHVTFFVSQFGNLDEDQIDKLRSLQADGHEIGFHGTHHTEAAIYLQTHSVQEYIDYDITPGLSQMRSAGFDVVDFAYPGGSDNPDATLALEGYFGHIRDTYYTWDDPYYQYGSNQAFINGIGIDDLTYGNTLPDIYDGILRAKEDDIILITYAHIPVQTASGDYQLSYDRLEKILINVTDNDMKFYTVSELI